MSAPTEGTGKLRALCLEDSPADAELVRETLAGAGFEVEMDLASDRPSFEERLAGGSYDVILADYSLPGFDARGALELTKVACPATPFICVSGAIGEEATVELLRSGADDIVLKDRLSRLPFAVERAIDERRREAALRLSQENQTRAEAFFRDTFEHAQVGIAHVDPTVGTYLRVNQSMCDLLGYSREELLCLTVFDTTHPDDIADTRELVRTLWSREAESGVLEKRYLRKDGSSVWMHLNEAAIRAENGTPDYNIPVIVDITERKLAEELLAGQAARISRTLTSVVDIASSIVELRDPYTAGHQRRVSEFAVKIAERLEMSGHQIDDIRVAGLLHDMGKAAIPAEILSKPGALSPIEFMLIKGHVEAGYQLAISANLAEPIADMIHQHHERTDGSGYPQGLAGDHIVMGAKVLAVADVVEAMSSHRPYRAALGTEAAMAEIELGAGVRYDSTVAKACAEVFGADGFAFSE